MKNHTAPAECSLNVQPQQNYFEFDQITFDSRFDSGNLAQAEKIENYKVFSF